MTDSKTDGIEQCLGRIRTAVSAGDAQAFAAEFDENATYVTFFGRALTGRREIEGFHAEAFTKFPAGTQMVIKVISTRLIGDDFASVLTVGAIGQGPDLPYDKLQTFALARRDGRWLCAAFHNTEMNAAAKLEYNAPEDASSMAAKS